MNSPVRYEIHDSIGVITVDNPPVNALSHAVRDGLADAIKAAQRDTSRAVVILCAGKTFFAGADITEFGKPPKEPFLPDLLNMIEDSTKPVVAALHGTALGGGFETALACHYRIALASAKVGFPEVKLGLFPGAGGTQRVPRLAGIAAAVELMASGDPVAAAKAAELGLVDKVVDQENCGEADGLCAATRHRQRADEASGDLTVVEVDKDAFDGIRARGRKARQRTNRATQNARLRAGVAGTVVCRRARERTRAVHGAHGRFAVQSVAPRILCRARGCQNQGPFGGRKTARSCDSRHHRRGHDGRRHCDELRQRRLSGDAARGQRRSARPRPRDHRQKLCGQRQAGQAQPGQGTGVS